MRQNAADKNEAQKCLSVQDLKPMDALTMMVALLHTAPALFIIPLGLIVLTLLAIIAALALCWQRCPQRGRTYLTHQLALKLGPEATKTLARKAAKLTVALLVAQAGVPLSAGSQDCLAELVAEATKAATLKVSRRYLSHPATQL